MKKNYPLIVAISAFCAANAAAPRTVCPVRSLDAPVPTAAEKTKKAEPQAASMWTVMDGTGTFTDDALTYFLGFSSRSWEVTVEKHRSQNIYRIRDPYAGHPALGEGFISDENRYMYINAVNSDNVYFCDANGNYDVYDTGVPVGAGGNAMMATYSWYASQSGMAVETGMGGVIKHGVITFPVQSLIVGLTKNPQQWSFGNSSGRMRIALPGASDYSVSLATAGQCAHGETFDFDVTFGSDVHEVKLGPIPNPYAPGAGWEKDVVNDGYGFKVQSGSYKYPVDQYAEHTCGFLMFVTLDESGVIQDVATREFTVDGDDSNWETLDGSGHFTDNYLSGVYGIDSEDYDVVVQRNKTNLKYFRVVNPYTNGGWSYARYADVCTDGNHYLYIDASDPANVYVESSALGIDMGGGPILFTSYAYLKKFYNFSQSFAGGTMSSSGLIELKGTALLFELNDNPGTWSFNSDGFVRLQLPESWAGIEAAGMDKAADAPVEYFNLQGMRVDNVEGTNGIYIRRQGDKVSKVYVK